MRERLQSLRWGSSWARTVAVALPLCAIATASAAENAASANPSSGSRERVVLQLPWTPGYQFVGYYVAVERGYCRDAGFDVELRHQTGAMDSVDEVLAGRAQFGVAGSRIVNRFLRGDPVLLLASVFQHAPDLVVAPESSGIRRLRDLAGKRVLMVSAGPGPVLSRMLAAEGIALTDLVLAQRSPGPVADAFRDGVADACFGYGVRLPVELREAGVPHVVFRASDYGEDFYGDSLFAAREAVRRDPDRARAFRDACLRGWTHALEHPEEALSFMASRYPALGGRAQLEEQAREVARLVDREFVAVGHMNRDRWRKVIPESVVARYKDEGLDAARELLFDEDDEVAARLRVRLLVQGLFALVVAVALLFGGILALRSLVRRRTEELAVANRGLASEVEERRVADAWVRLHRDVAVELAQSGSLGRSLERLVERLVAFPGIDSAVVYLQNEAGHAFEMAACRGLGDEVRRAFAVAPEDSNVARAAASRRPVWHTDPESLRAPSAVLRREGLASAMVVPAIHEDRTVAVLALGSHGGPLSDPRMLPAMESVAASVAGALVRLRGAAALEEREQSFRRVAEAAFDGVAVMGPRGEMLFVNSGMVRLLGARPEDVGVTRFLDYVPPEARARIGERFRRRAMGEVGPATFEFDLLAAGGRRVPVEVVVQPIQWRGAPALLYTFRDATTRKRLEHELLSVVEWERQRIARDLHDGLGQVLVGMGYMADVLGQRLAEDCPKHADTVARLREACAAAHAQTRAMVRGMLTLREGEDLAAALARLVREVEDRLGIVCVFEGTVGDVALPAASAEHLYQIAQEAITNAVRHGKASRVTVALRRAGEGWAMVVEDDGAGFDVDAMADHAGSGLRIARYRADLAGAVLRIERPPEGGTRLSCLFGDDAAVGVLREESHAAL